jgi:hypothetical protein
MKIESSKFESCWVINEKGNGGPIYCIILENGIIWKVFIYQL